MTTAEIDKLYLDHIESLRLSGLPFNLAGILKCWAQELSEAKD